jgi:hypothetical protein
VHLFADHKVAYVGLVVTVSMLPCIGKKFPSYATVGKTFNAGATLHGNIDDEASYNVAINQEHYHPNRFRMNTRKIEQWALSGSQQHP